MENDTSVKPNADKGWVQIGKNLVHIPKSGINQETKFVIGMHCYDTPQEDYDDNVVTILSNELNGYHLETTGKINDVLKQIQIQENLPETPTIDAYIGFSQGCEGALFYGTGDRNKSVKTVVLFDPKYVFEDGPELVKKPKNAIYLDQAKKEHKVIIALERTKEINSSQLFKNYESVAKAGIPLVLCFLNTESHTEVRNANMYDIIGLLSGDEDKAQNILNRCKSVYVWDETLAADGDWKELTTSAEIIDVSRKSVYASLSTIGDIVTCNNIVIKNALNGIRRAIQSSSFLTNSLNFNSSSTTKIPSQEISKIKEITDAIAQVYQKLTTDTEEIAFMSDTYDDLDTVFSQIAESVNDSMLTYARTAVDTARAKNKADSYTTVTDDKSEEIEYIDFN